MGNFNGSCSLMKETNVWNKRYICAEFGENRFKIGTVERGRLKTCAMDQDRCSDHGLGYESYYIISLIN